ncbi:MAG: hypothetical protein OHK0036_04580 [Bacteroidia bacterium]
MNAMRFLFFLLPLFIATHLCSQNIAINSTGMPPDNSALLDVGNGNANTGGDTKGLLIPRVALTSSTDVTTIPSPAKSLLVWNTGSGGLTPAGFYYWDGTQWVQLATGSGGGGGKNSHCFTCDGF